MAKLEPYSYKPTVAKTGNFVDDMRAEFDVVEAEAKEAQDRWSDTGDILGAIYREPYADGYATYKVTNLSPFTVAHVAVGDAWSLPAPHIRGLTADDVHDRMYGDLKLRELFGRK